VNRVVTNVKNTKENVKDSQLWKTKSGKDDFLKVNKTNFLKRIELKWCRKIWKINFIDLIVILIIIKWILRNIPHATWIWRINLNRNNL